MSHLSIIIIIIIMIIIMIILYLVLMMPASAHLWIRSRYFMRELLFWSQDTWRPEPKPK